MIRAGSDELTARVGETRRLTFMYCDVVGSTALSRVHDLEAYHDLMEDYRRACYAVIEERFEGHIVHHKGDGVLSAFGFPVAHENDAERAVRAALALLRAVREIVSPVTREPLGLRVGVHNGTVYRKFADDDILGFATNIGARYESLAEPDTVVVSDEVRLLVEDRFELEPGEPQHVKGSPEPLRPFRVVGERAVRMRRPWAGPLVEREGDLEALRTAWAPVRDGTAAGAAGVLVWGDAGVGKSRLVAALAGEAQAAAVVQLHGSPFHGEAGLHPIRTLVEERCGIDRDAAAPERLACLERDVTQLGLDTAAALPLLAPVLGIGPSAGYEPVAAEGRRLEEQVAQAVRDYVLACAAPPALIVAEDVHWFDAATRELLASLLATGPGHVLVVATSREPERGRWNPIELRPLTLPGRFALIDALAGRLDERDRLTLATRSDGIPLYVEELVRAGRTAGPVGAIDVAPVPGSVPAALYEPLVACLYATPAALPLAAAAAAAGQEVDRSLLAATTSLADEQLDSTLGTLVAARVLERTESTTPRYRFRHELLREVAYELQPPSWRRRVHDRLCDLLSGDEPGDWYVLASHFERAERFSEAADAYQHTAEWARRRGALEEARGHLTRAVELVRPLPANAGRDHREVQLLLRRGMLAMSSEGAGSADAAADLQRCRELAAADPLGDDMFSTLIALWSYYLSRAELDRAREVSETLRAALDGERGFFRPQNRAGFGMLDWFGGRFASALDALAAATDELIDVGKEDDVARAWFVPNDPTVAMHAHLGLARFMTGDEVGAERSLAQARALASVLDFPHGPWSGAYATWLSSWVWIESGRFELAEAALVELLESSARHGFEAWELIAATQAVVVDAVRELRAPTPDREALAEYAETVAANVAMWQLLDLRIFLPFYLTTAGALLAAGGDADGARERYEESLALAAETGMRFYDAETLRLLAHVLPERRAALEAALDVAQAQGAALFEPRIADDLRTG